MSSNVPKSLAMLAVMVLARSMCAARLDQKISLLRHRHLEWMPRESPLFLNKCIDPMLQVRGGQSSSNDPFSNAPPSYPQYQQQPQQQQEQPLYDPNNPDQGFDNYIPPNDIADTDHLFQESVQDRVDRWRQEQMALNQNLTPQQELNMRDAQGRMKLIASVSRGSRALIFFMIMWRDVHLFELADQGLKGFQRLLVVVPLILLFIGNMAGVVASFTSPSHSSKKRMKAILYLDKVVEGILLIWYFFRLTVFPSKYVPREVYVAKTLHSVLFLVQLQAFTRVTW